ASSSRRRPELGRQILTVVPGTHARSAISVTGSLADGGLEGSLLSSYCRRIVLAEDGRVATFSNENKTFIPKRRVGGHKGGIVCVILRHSKKRIGRIGVINLVNF